jgi:5-methylcytosine-specific restriction endonuclease McrA
MNAAPRFESPERGVNALQRALARGAESIELVTYEQLRQRDGHDCYLCGEFVTRKTVSMDHVIPVSRGGNHTRENLRLAHSRCNSLKGDRLLSEINLREFEQRLAA